MFGIGGSEILVILVIALIFLGPDKLPDAAKQISKGIRDLKRQSRILQETIENDEHIGGAIRDLKSALRDEPPTRPPVRKPVKKPEIQPGDEVVKVLDSAVPAAAAALAPGATPADAATTATSGESAPDGADAEADARPPITLPVTAGEADPSVHDDTSAEELAAMIRPAAGTVAKGSPEPSEAEPEPAKRTHG